MGWFHAKGWLWPARQDNPTAWEHQSLISELLTVGGSAIYTMACTVPSALPEVGT